MQPACQCFAGQVVGDGKEKIVVQNCWCCSISLAFSFAFFFLSSPRTEEWFCFQPKRVGWEMQVRCFDNAVNVAKLLRLFFF